MRRLIGFVLLLGCCGHTQAAPPAEDFKHRLGAYWKIHNKVEAEFPLKPTNSPDQITAHEHEFARRIRDARPAAVQGEIFTPPATAEFERLLERTLRGPAGPRIRKSLSHAEPVILSLKVNDEYPAGAPLQSTPATLLLNLPKLPRGLEYRVVGHSLVLRDAAANLVVDFIPDAIR